MEKRLLMTLAASLVLTTSACAQPSGSGPSGESAGPGTGPGMMSGGAGPGSAASPGPGPGPGPRGGYGYGPGMMGGYGPGMMGGYGPGMMGGYGYGPGMMGGYGGGYGPGMMGGYGPRGWGLNIPDLTNDQRSKISGFQKEFREKQWDLMEKMHENFQSGNYYRDGKFDDQAARKAYDTTASLHKQMFENHIEMQKRIDSVLTPQQREQLQRARGGR